ncbi:MAG: helix-turn-helix domain-containing protein [Pseudolabrys sp.]|nr:helix-turn-helix domain-containing protein [Pseudolabrys sp.]
MLNDLFTPSTGPNGLLEGLKVLSVELGGDGMVVAEVAASSRASVECPNCGARRYATGTRIVRFRDIPHGERAVVLSWRRRHFVCARCRQPSFETLPVFEESHRVTTRLVEWIWQEAARSTFMDMARRCGLSQRTVIGLFNAARRRDSSTRPVFPFNLGVATVEIAGLPRLVLCNTADGAVVDVYRSLESFKDSLGVSLLQAPSAKRLAMDLALHGVECILRDAFRVDGLLVPPQSVGRYAADLMLRASEAAIAAQAHREGRTAKTRLILFSRRRGDLGRVGARRLWAWSNDAPAIALAYDLKEELLELCGSWRRQGWENWKSGAARLPYIGGEASTRIDYGGVVALIDRYAEGIEGYLQERGAFREYERTLSALADLAPTGARSFAGARAYVLQKFGQRPDGGGPDEREGRRSF